MILIDTHVAIWIATNSQLLGPRSKAMIEEASAAQALAISAISFWEIALLIVKGRFNSKQTPEQLRYRLITAGVTEIALNGELAIAAAELPDMHADPADRFIAATAMKHGATLVTADAALLRWRHATSKNAAQ